MNGQEIINEKDQKMGCLLWYSATNLQCSCSISLRSLWRVVFDLLSFVFVCRSQLVYSFKVLYFLYMSYRLTVNSLFCIRNSSFSPASPSPSPAVHSPVISIDLPSCVLHLLKFSLLLLLSTLSLELELKLDEEPVQSPFKLSLCCWSYFNLIQSLRLLITRESHFMRSEREEDVCWAWWSQASVIARASRTVLQQACSLRYSSRYQDIQETYRAAKTSLFSFRYFQISSRNPLFSSSVSLRSPSICWLTVAISASLLLSYQFSCSSPQICSMISLIQVMFSMSRSRSPIRSINVRWLSSGRVRIRFTQLFFPPLWMPKQTTSFVRLRVWLQGEDRLCLKDHFSRFPNSLSMYWFRISTFFVGEASLKHSNTSLSISVRISQREPWSRTSWKDPKAFLRPACSLSILTQSKSTPACKQTLKLIAKIIIIKPTLLHQIIITGRKAGNKKQLSGDLLGNGEQSCGDGLWEWVGLFLRLLE